MGLALNIRFTDIIDLFNDFLAICELDNKKPGNIVKANSFLLNKIGYTAEELYQIRFIDFLDPEPKKEIKDIFECCFTESKFTTVFITKESIWIDVDVETHILTVDNKEYGIIIARDITEIKRFNEEFNFLNEELINQKENFQALIDNLTQTQEQLVQSEKMAALGQLIAGIAHEINTPLGAIKASVGNISASLDKTIDSLPEIVQNLNDNDKKLFIKILKMADPEASANLSSRDKRKLRREICAKLEENKIDSADSLADVCIYLNLQTNFDEILPLFKSDETPVILNAVKNIVSLDKNRSTISIAVEKASKVVFALKKFAHHDTSGEMVEADIIDSIETVLTLYHNQIKQGITIVRNFDELPVVNCYADEVNQVWTNLIQNALQSMGQKGTLTIGAFIEDANVVVTITDTGSGIEPDIAEKIFQPFFTTKKSGEGSGLGLDIVKKIIDKHEGSITFESEINKGTTFRIELPLSN